MDPRSERKQFSRLNSWWNKASQVSNCISHYWLIGHFKTNLAIDIVYPFLEQIVTPWPFMELDYLNNNILQYTQILLQVIRNARAP